MADDTRICNQALRHLAVSKTISNITTEESEEAEACRDFLEDAKEEVLRDFPHPFSTEQATLGLVGTNPTTEYGYSYRYPSRSIFFRRILSGIRNDNRQSKIHYRIFRDSNGKLIYTDEPNAVAEYTIFESDVSVWPVDLRMALTLLLASYIAPSVTDGDQNKLGMRALEYYLISKSKAEANALNELQPEEEPQSEFIRGRE